MRAIVTNRRTVGGLCAEEGAGVQVVFSTTCCAFLVSFSPIAWDCVGAVLCVRVLHYRESGKSGRSIYMISLVPEQNVFAGGCPLLDIAENIAIAASVRVQGHPAAHQGTACQCGKDGA